MKRAQSVFFSVVHGYQPPMPTRNKIVGRRIRVMGHNKWRNGTDFQVRAGPTLVSLYLNANLYQLLVKAVTATVLIRSFGAISAKGNRLFIFV